MISRIQVNDPSTRSTFPVYVTSQKTNTELTEMTQSVVPPPPLLLLLSATEGAVGEFLFAFLKAGVDSNSLLR